MMVGDYLEQLKQRRIRITPQRLEILRAILEGTRAAGHPL
ncbi:MAG: Ferric uptake regulator, Fur family, partial [Thermacetogenium phaeum]